MASRTDIPKATVVAKSRQSERFASQAFHLVLLNTEDHGRSYDVGDETRIGKAADNDIVVDHPTVSRNHGVLRRQGDRFVIEDVGSTNGTFVDGAQVREAFIKPGSLLEVGDVQLRFSPTVKALDVAPQLESRLGDLVGESIAMRQVFSVIRRLAQNDSTLLIIGETGTGKGAASKAIHDMSPRAKGPFVVFDCASVAKTLIESELFGHEKGAFTGATSQRQGCLERVDGGTLFLDEIDDLALDLQPKLLRALEDRQFRRLGGSATVGFDARVIVASKKDLWTETQAGRFREDLYFRLSVFSLTLPPLRDRREDLGLLVDAFAGRPLWSQLPQEHRGQLSEHSWPGNVRELRNVVERIEQLKDLAVLPGQPIVKEPSRTMASPGRESLPVRYDGTFKELKDEVLQAFEKEYLTRLLKKVDGNIARAAREANVDRKHFYSLLYKYALATPQGED